MGLAKFFLYLFFFIFGAHLSEDGRKLKGYKYLILFMVLSIVWYFLSDGKLLEDVYTKAVLGTLGSLFFLSVFQGVTAKNGFSKLGENTLIVYLTHGWILAFVQEHLPLQGLCKIEFFLIMIISCCLAIGAVIVLLEKFIKLKCFLLRPSKFWYLLKVR